MFDEMHWVHYIPLASTVLSVAFLAILLQHYFARGCKPHVGWWALGVFTYGLGTGLEGAISLLGNTEYLNKSWYVAGALLGGYPLAQGSAYLHLKRKTANLFSALTVPFIIIFSVLTFMSPIRPDMMQDFKPSGAVLEWQFIRYFTPIINIYAVIFLIGGAILSAARYFKANEFRNRAIGNSLIAFGAILPGVGGAYAKGGYVEMLYIGEFLGIIFIWMGYWFCKPKKIAAQNI